MASEPEGEGLSPSVMEYYESVIEGFSKDVQELNSFKDLFFKNHPMELAVHKNDMVDKKRDEISKKYEDIDETGMPTVMRAQFLYLKGRCYNMASVYDGRALECLSKAVKLDPTLINAWNELGECYWKNFNLKEAKACFEGALNQKRDRVALRSLSILLRQDNGTSKTGNVVTNAPVDAKATIMQSVDYAKEAVALDTTDGQSWSVLGNAYLCQFFLVAQEPMTLKLALGAYKQAWNDPITMGQPDLHYNKGMGLKYDEKYGEAIESFKMAHRLDPPWEPPVKELKQLVEYLTYVDQLLKTKGKLKAKRITHMVKSMVPSMFGDHQPGSLVPFGSTTLALEHTKISDLLDGDNAGRVVMGRVLGSMHSNNAVPFTFAMIDESMACVAVNVYNWADGRGVLIGDSVAIPEPRVATHTNTTDIPEEIVEGKFIDAKNKNKGKKTELAYNFRTIRVNDPTTLRVNGKRVGVEEYASTRVTSTYEAH